MANKKILLGLTTTPASDWRDKIEEIRRLNITEISFFPTFLKSYERKELYKLLENSPVKNIPHVHLRNDMELQEINYLVNNFKTRTFNIHSEKEYPLLHDLSLYNSIIYVENTILPKEEEFNKFAGICIDFSHWHDEALRNNSNYDKKMRYFVKTYKIGCCHVSAIKKEPILDKVIKDCLIYASHWIDNLDELSYLKKYNEYLPEYISIELENSFETQLKVKEYLEKIING